MATWIIIFDLDGDLTFLTGINGSGKTTVLNCIMALISPSLQTLANTDFESISVDLEQDGERTSVKATKLGNTIRIAIDDIEFGFNTFPKR